MAMKFAVYLVGLLLVLAAIWLLLTNTGITSIVPIGLIAVGLLLILGLGIMGASERVSEPVGNREVVETRQQVGDTEIRRSQLK